MYTHSAIHNIYRAFVMHRFATHNIYCAFVMHRFATHNTYRAFVMYRFAIHNTYRAFVMHQSATHNTYRLTYIITLPHRKMVRWLVNDFLGSVKILCKTQNMERRFFKLKFLCGTQQKIVFAIKISLKPRMVLNMNSRRCKPTEENNTHLYNPKGQ